jgi:hypothetical protein
MEMPKWYLLEGSYDNLSSIGPFGICVRVNGLKRAP